MCVCAVHLKRILYHVHSHTVCQSRPPATCCATPCLSQHCMWGTLPCVGSCSQARPATHFYVLSQHLTVSGAKGYTEAMQVVLTCQYVPRQYVHTHKPAQTRLITDDTWYLWQARAKHRCAPTAASLNASSHCTKCRSRKPRPRMILHTN